MKFICNNIVINEFIITMIYYLDFCIPITACMLLRHKHSSFLYPPPYGLFTVKLVKKKRRFFFEIFCLELVALFVKSLLRFLSKGNMLKARWFEIEKYFKKFLKCFCGISKLWKDFPLAYYFPCVRVMLEDRRRIWMFFIHTPL